MKHKILSISLSSDLAKEIDTLQREMGFSGRSELVRAGLRKLLSETKQQQPLKGHTEAIFLVAHNKQAEADVIQAKHTFDDIIKTQIHSNLQRGKCLEVFVVSGQAGRVKQMANHLNTNKKIDDVKLVVT